MDWQYASGSQTWTSLLPILRVDAAGTGPGYHARIYHRGVLQILHPHLEANNLLLYSTYTLYICMSALPFG